jgi:hypothetical protein
MVNNLWGNMWNIWVYVEIGRRNDVKGWGLPLETVAFSIEAEVLKGNQNLLVGSWCPHGWKSMTLLSSVPFMQWNLDFLYIQQACRLCSLSVHMIDKIKFSLLSYMRVGTIQEVWGCYTSDVTTLQTFSWKEIRFQFVLYFSRKYVTLVIDITLYIFSRDGATIDRFWIDDRIIGFIGVFDTTCDFTAQFTVTHMHMHVHTHTHPCPQSCLHCHCLVALPLGSQTVPSLSYQLLTPTAHNNWIAGIL